LKLNKRKMGAHAAKMNKRKIAEISKRTSFTPAEVKNWHDGFLADCPTGLLTKFEFSKIYAEFFPTGNPIAFASFVFNVFDEDNSGYIDFEEFLMALSVTSRGNIEDKLEWAFKLYDIDGNGSITKDEMEHIIEAIYGMTGQHHLRGTVGTKVDEIFTAMDTDGNGELSKEEFIAGARNDKTIVEAFSLYDGLV